MVLLALSQTNSPYNTVSGSLLECLGGSAEVCGLRLVRSPLLTAKASILSLH